VGGGLIGRDGCLSILRLFGLYRLWRALTRERDMMIVLLKLLKLGGRLIVDEEASLSLAFSKPESLALA
jgi:hypothetical protein